MNKTFTYILIILSLITVLILILFLFPLSPKQNINSQNQLLRIHIRANSNETTDQEIKYEIKKALTTYLTPKLAEIQSINEAKQFISSNLQTIENVANSTLNLAGFNYTAKAKLNNEYFPTRSYEGYTVDSGFYDSLIIELGNASGNNWWCVVYPPLCFINAEPTNSQQIIYKSKLLEIIKKYFQ